MPDDHRHEDSRAEEMILLTRQGNRRIDAAVAGALEQVRVEGGLAAAKTRMLEAQRRNDWESARTEWKEAETKTGLLPRWASAAGRPGSDLPTAHAAGQCLSAVFNKMLNDVWTETARKGLPQDGKADAAFGGRLMAAFRQGMTTAPVEIAMDLSRERVQRLYALRGLENALARDAGGADPSEDALRAAWGDRLSDTVWGRMYADLKSYRERMRSIPDDSGVLEQVKPDDDDDAQASILDSVESAGRTNVEGYADRVVREAVWSILSTYCLPELKENVPSHHEVVETFLGDKPAKASAKLQADPKKQRRLERAINTLRACLEKQMRIRIRTED